MKLKKAQWLVLILLMAWYGWFFLERIDLTVVDLGRHIMNGEVVLRGEWGILNSNFYSYTEPNFPVVNHHWGAGVIFYGLQQVFGFAGLSFFYILLSLTVFYLFFWIAQKEAGFNLSIIISSLLIPLMAARTEIRPEGFSYFFIAIFFWILWRWRKGEISNMWLWVLPLLQLIWVNTHIYFIFGIALVGLFWVGSRTRRCRMTSRTSRCRMELGKVLGLTGLLSLVSPFGLKGLLYPFNILREYGYRIVENQSVSFLTNWGFKDPNLVLFEMVLAILILSYILLFLRNRKRLSFIYIVLGLVWGGLAFMAIRNFTLFAFFSLVIIGYNLKHSKLEVEKLSLAGSVLAAMFILLNSLYFYNAKLPWSGRFGFGLVKNNLRSVEFYNDQNIKGPVFNNYDVGAYLIYNFYPDWKVFTDNRPEAYSVSHFKDVYIPAQYENDVWQKLDDEYGFNVIYFSHRDYTDWGQKFLIERVKDEDWAVVYYDSFVIIYLKRNELNERVIKQYEISSEVFGL